ncbi:phosphatase PAP2 family protein [Natronolimnohabitans sp. A-GB9]|uniref:phosphatase PAP2 family protein n=1 Tax=Natronolimnohabitans sp. A-GB9 TaxID=3069757 RepID=UPI0027B4062E|nr:phosphatase PAP2 family protein [Natronolimnohabitans sp. A-GB9]MDQ2050879.1 phosphatase PAP2 family protein [Natronolimnohabitans sp. A-GB9]
MSRGIGEFAPIQDLIPDWAAVLVGLVTQLGDVWFLALLVGVVYWFHARRRDDAAVTVGLSLTGLALITILKHVFELPRPGQPLVALEALPGLVQPLYEATAMASGYGFPSGHALMTTIVYVSLAKRLSIGTARQRLLAAAAVVAVVSLSRIALGVHYLVDIVAGIAIGLAFLFVAERLLARTSTDGATVALAMAVVASVIALLVSSVDPDAVLLVGASLGSFAGWQLVCLGRAVAAADRPSHAVRPLVSRGTLAAGAIVPLIAVLDSAQLLSVPAASAALGLAMAAFVAAPVLYGSERTGRVWTALTFWATMTALGLRSLRRSSTWRRGFAVGRRCAGHARRWLRAQSLD